MEQMSAFLEGPNPEILGLPEDYDPGEIFPDGDLWQKICYKDCSDLLCMDITLDKREEEDDYGVNFEGHQRMVELFFSGSSDHFPGIWVGKDDLKRLDEYPIYILDLSSDEYTFQPVGNFRQYIQKLLDDFLETHDQDDVYTKTAQWMCENIHQFSNNCIDKGDYTLKLTEENPKTD